MSLVSLYDAASLWMTPSGAEDGKLFSELPTDGSGDFTFSRGSNLAATRVGPTGLIEKGRENLLLQSNQFDTTWVLTDSINLTSGQTGYDGSSDAWKLENTLSAKYLHQSIAVSGVQTISFYAKSGTLDWAFLLINSSNVPRVYFDLQNGLVGSELGSVIDSKIESVDATGWYRISITFNETISQIRIYPAAADNDITGTGSIYIQDAQVEIGLAATDYIESGATTGKAGLLENEPRLDYSGGATCPSLLLEPQRTNLVPFSEYWKGYFTIDTDVTISVNVATSPEGVQNAGRLKYDLASRSMYKSAMGLTGEHSVSFWVKGDGSNIGKTFNLRLQGTSIDQNIPITLTSDWVRVEAQTNGLNILELNNRNSTTIDTGSLLLYGFQIELGSYPTSYIPNHSGGSVTRNFDYSIVESLGYSSTYTFYYEFNTTTGRETSSPFAEVGKNQSNKIWIKGASANNPQFSVQGNGIFNGSISPTNEVSGTNKIAVQCSSGVGVVFCNGVKQSGTLTNSNTSENIDFISAKGQGTSHDLKQLLFFEEALSDAECITLTQL